MRKIKKKQLGGKVGITKKEEISNPDFLGRLVNYSDKEVTDWTKDYITSPKYKERLANFYPDPNKIISERLKQLENIDIFSFGENSGVYSSMYNPESNEVYLDKATINSLPGNKRDITLAHELSHVTNGNPFNTSLRLAPEEENYIFDKEATYGYGNSYLKKGEPSLGEIYKTLAKKGNTSLSRFLSAKLNIHDAAPAELKSDIDGLRFQLKKAGIYDAGTQNMTQEILDKAKKNINLYKSFDLNRLQKHLSDKDLIDIMNKVASKDNTLLPIAKKGGIAKGYKQVGGITLPEVEVTAKLPNWAKYKKDFETLLPFKQQLNQYLTGFSRSLGNSESNYPERLDQQYDQLRNDYISRGLILDRSNDKYTDKERAIINSSNYKGKNKEEVYNNPQTLPIGTGAKAMDFLYDNSFLLKTPGARQILQKLVSNSINQLDVTNATKIDKNLNGDNFDEEDKELSKLSAYSDDKFNPLSQFLGKSQGATKSKYKPKNDYFNFLPSYSIKDVVGVGTGKDGYANDIASNYSDPKTIDSIKKNPMYFGSSDIEMMYEKIPNLGHYKSGVAWDKDKNLPYMFVSDAWDFEPQGYAKNWGKAEDAQSTTNAQRAYQQAFLMNKVGNPYKIYDRFYYEPKTGTYIDDTKDPRFKKELGGAVQSKNMKTSLVYKQMGGPAKPNFLQQLQQAGDTFGQEPIDKLLMGTNWLANLIGTGKENSNNKAYQDFYQRQMMQPSELVNPNAFGNPYEMQMGGVIAKSKADQAGGYFKYPDASSIEFPGSGTRQFVPGPFPLLVKDANGIQFLNNSPIKTKGRVTEYPVFQMGGQVNFTAKPVDEENATIEAEKGEYILGGGAAKNPFDGESSDIGVGLYKIGGNKHYNGGTKLAANPGDFIFSDDKKLAFDQEVAKELVGRDITKTRLRTPAKLVDNYNKLNHFINMSQDSKATAIDRKTAILNTENILDKLADIAIGQEAKKGFPNGIPAFAQASLQKRTTGAESSPTEMQPNLEGNDQESFQTGGIYSGGWGNSAGTRREDLYMIQPGATNNSYYEMPWPDRPGVSRPNYSPTGVPVDLGDGPDPEPRSFSATDFLKNTFGNFANLFGTSAQAAPATTANTYGAPVGAYMGAQAGMTGSIGNYWDRYGIGQPAGYPALQYGTPNNSVVNRVNLTAPVSTTPSVVDNPSVPYTPKAVGMNVLGNPNDVPNYSYGNTQPLILPNGSQARTLGGGRPSLKDPTTRDYNSRVNPNAAELYGLYAANKRYANRYPTAQRNFELDNVDAIITSNYKPLSAQPYLNNIQRQLATFNSNNSGFGPVSYARNSYAFVQALNAQQQAIGQVEQQNIQRQDQMNQLLAQNQGAKGQSRLQLQDKYLNQLEAVNNNAEMASKSRMANTSMLLNAYTRRKQEQQATNAMLDNFEYDANGNLRAIPGRSLKDAVMNSSTSTQMSTQLGYAERLMQMMQRYGIKGSGFIDDIIKNATGVGR